MTTAIIGVGNIGSAVARHLVAGDEIVVVAAKEGSHADALAQQLGPRARAASVEEAISGGDVDVIVDLGERADASSDLLTVLHRCARRVTSLGGTLAVVCARSELRRLFDVTLLSQGFDVYASRAEALRTWA